MKYLIVAPHYFPKIGGVERYIKNLVDGRSSTDEFILITASEPQVGEKVVKDSGVKIYYLPYQFKISNTPVNFLWYRKIRQIIKKENPDVINTHSPVPYMADLGILAAKNIPVIATYHSGSMVKGKSPVDFLLKIYESIFLPSILRKADYVIAIHPDFIKQVLREENEKIIYIPPGIDTNVYSPDKTVNKVFDVTYVGRIELTSQWKGIDVLLDAISCAAKSIPSIKLQIVGDGDAVSLYQAKVKALGIEKNVTFTGALREGDLVQAYLMSRLVVLPSKTDSESFGMTLAEAMSCGLPVIASRIGGIPNLINNTESGLLVEPNNPIELGEAIKSLLQNKQLSESIGRAARKRIISKFSLSTQVQNTLNLFNKSYTEQRNTPTRVAHLTAHYPPYLGGMEQRIQELSEKLSLRNYEVTVLTSSEGSYPHTDFISSNLVVKHLKSLEIAHTAIIPGLIFELMKLPRKTIIHVHIAHAFIPEVVAIFCKLTFRPYIAHIRLDVPPSGTLGKFLLPLYKKYILKYVVRGAAKVIVLTPDYVPLISRKYGIPERKFSVIPNATVFSTAKGPKKIGNQPIKLLFVGRLSSQKNVPLLLSGVKEYTERPNAKTVQLNIVGDGELRRELTDITRALGINNISHFTGALHGEKLEKIYKEADIFILTSTHESFGTVLLEAMSKGVPIIATNITAVKNTVRHNKNGLLIESSPTALANAIEVLIEDSDLYRTLSSNNVVDIRDYSWDTVLSKTESVYNEIIHN